ncbi:double-stranded RNA-specific editase B2-like [Thrips palmi]|uniref:Double-stranded RNA-specific editase B2-like n=1 Tax=Thrips palmi TaxID=161013 RepID=A0A6P8ZVG0_THRPL|nr:double-stranded RNA-specific editase B2-like [Thrips palmi]
MASNNNVMNPLSYPNDQSFGTGAMDTSTENDNFEAQGARKPWLKRPGGAIVKVAPDVKRRRRNYQAKKLMIPKNPLMILNELKPGLPYNISEKSENNQTVFVVSVEIDGSTFLGQAPSKKLAQQEAAESALRGLYFDKLMDQLVKKEDEDTPMKEEDSQTDAVKNQVPEDDTPWSSLASLAMFKLAALWQGSTKPFGLVTSQNSSLNQGKIPSNPSENSTLSPCPKGKLPSNAAEVNPVMLLHQISPQSKFTEQARDVRNGATVFTLTVDFNGQYFCGSATNKKTAKKICAKAALQSYGVEYTD